MLQVQLLVPSINADATVTANMKRDEELELELKSEIKVMDATSEQKITMKYGNYFFRTSHNNSFNTCLLLRDVHILSELMLKFGTTNMGPKTNHMTLSAI